jgi:hypothetical protein
MHGPIKVKSPNNTSKWQKEFNSAFKGLMYHFKNVLLFSFLIPPAKETATTKTMYCLSYVPDGRKIVVRFLARAQDFLFYEMSRFALGSLKIPATQKLTGTFSETVEARN